MNYLQIFEASCNHAVRRSGRTTSAIEKCLEKDLTFVVSNRHQAREYQALYPELKIALVHQSLIPSSTIVDHFVVETALWEANRDIESLKEELTAALTTIKTLTRADNV